MDCHISLADTSKCYAPYTMPNKTIRSQRTSYQNFIMVISPSSSSPITQRSSPASTPLPMSRAHTSCPNAGPERESPSSSAPSPAGVGTRSRGGTRVDIFLVSRSVLAAIRTPASGSTTSATVMASPSPWRQQGAAPGQMCAPPSGCGADDCSSSSSTCGQDLALPSSCTHEACQLGPWPRRGMLVVETA